MIMPNHSSHADPYTIYAAADAVGTALHVMATWHVFHDKPRLVQWALRKHGCFSVDREANDIGAFRLATDILQNKREPLVIFPEGEIYHCNDRVTPFREGAAAIAVASARKADRPIVCVPCAITYRYIEDPTEAMLETMGDLEEAIFWRRQNRPYSNSGYPFRRSVAGREGTRVFPRNENGQMPDRIRTLGDHILDEVETRHDLDGWEIDSRTSQSGAAHDHRKAVAESVTPQTRKTLDDDLEDLFLVVQSFSYPGDYVDAKPSIERMAETLDKFEEDVLRKSNCIDQSPSPRKSAIWRSHRCHW